MREEASSMREYLFALAVAVAGVGAVCTVARADVHAFTGNPTANSADFLAWSAGRGLALDLSLQFGAHPDGPLIPDFFQASSGVVITGDGAFGVETGFGSLEGNTKDPGGIGEGLLPEPLRYMQTGFGAITTIDFTFDAPVAAFGFLTADMYRWGKLTPNAFIEAYDSAGDLLLHADAVDESFEFDYLYFMGVGDDDGRISRVRFINYGVAGDSIYLVGGVIGRAGDTCAADFNADGSVNSQDFFDFLTAFFATDPSSDFNHDGSVNSQDFFDFLVAFFAGC
jgi:hypothetical protein